MSPMRARSSLMSLAAAAGLACAPAAADDLNLGSARFSAAAGMSESLDGLAATAQPALPESSPSPITGRAFRDVHGFTAQLAYDLGRGRLYASAARDTAGGASSGGLGDWRPGAGFDVSVTDILSFGAEARSDTWGGLADPASALSLNALKAELNYRF